MSKRYVTLTIIIALLVLFLLYKRNQAIMRNHQILNNLHSVCLALHNYHDTYGRFPPASIVNHSQCIGSWRFRLLPFLQAFDGFEYLEKPWREGPYHKMQHKTYCISSHFDDEGCYATNILAVTGPDTVFSSGHFQYDMSRTIMLIGVGDSRIPWGEVGDLEVDATGHVQGKWPLPLKNKWYAICFGDGAAWLLHKDVPKEKLELFFSLKTANENDPNDLLAPYCIAKYPL